MAKIRRDAGESLDDDAAILLMSRCVLEGPADEGRSSYQVALTVCERCRHGRQQGRGELIEVSEEAVAMAECDGQHVGYVETRVESGAHVGTDDEERAKGIGTHESARATQTIPPALRRAVLRRDGGCCRVPGCRHATFVDVHHLRLRSEGGEHSLENLVTLCCAHHSALHAGTLLIDAAPSRGLSFRHADGTAYGHLLASGGVAVRVKAYRALVALGFRESETKRALARVPVNLEMTVQDLLRHALCELAPARQRADTR